jgi:predicted peptidase
MRCPIVLLCSLAPLLGGITLSTAPTFAADAAERFEKHVHEDAAGARLPYRLLKPKEIEEGQKYPLVVFLHGAGERGDDNTRQLVHGMGDYASDELMKKHPAFVVAPQCPEEKQWVEVPWSADSHKLPEKPSQPLRQTLELIDRLVKEQPIDENRIYITGLSMGGFGVWDALARRPKLFAAAAPICSGGDPATAERIKHVPVWAFHGDQDNAVKVQRSREMIDALKRAGGEPKYTEYEGVGHNSWTATYSNREFHDWLFAQQREAK